MANENYGILGGYDPLIGPTGRAYMAGERRGMTPEQMAQNGAISFADAIALKQMADRARASAQAMQAQQTPQPQPTVVDELKTQVAGSAAMPFREGGLAGLPVQNIGTRAMASGGIVAFSSGNLVESEIRRILATPMYRRTPAEIQKLVDAGYSRYAEERGPATAAPPAATSSPVPQPVSGISRPPPPTNLMVDAEPPLAPAAPPAPLMSDADIREMFRTDPYVAGGGGGSGLASLAGGAYAPATGALEAQLKDIQGRKYDTRADYERAGIGAVSKAQEAKIQKDFAKMPEDKRFAALMALAEAGFGMAVEASKPGATPLGAAAAGGTEGLKSYVAGRKELREREERLGDKQSALAQTREDLTRAAMDKDAALRRGDQEQAQQISIEIGKLKAKENELRLQLRDSAANREAMIARDQDPNRRMTSAYYQAKLSGNEPRAQQILAAIAEVRGIDVSVLRQQLADEERMRRLQAEADLDPVAQLMRGAGAGGGASGYNVLGVKPGT